MLVSNLFCNNYNLIIASVQYKYVSLFHFAVQGGHELVCNFVYLKFPISFSE